MNGIYYQPPQKPGIFEEEFVLRQLRYTGMLETIQIRKASYPVRFIKDDFCRQFRYTPILPQFHLNSNFTGSVHCTLYSVQFTRVVMNNVVTRY